MSNSYHGLRIRSIGRAIILSVLCIAFGKSVALAENKPEVPSLVKKIPTDYDTLFYLGDIATHLDGLLASERTKSVLSGVESASNPFNPEEIRVQLLANSDFFPSDSVIACDSNSLGQIGELGRIGLLGALANFNNNANEKIQLRDDALALLDQFYVPKLLLVARFSKEQTAQQLMGMASQYYEMLPPVTGLELRDNVFRFDARVGQFVDEELLRIYAVGFGFAETDGDEYAERFARILKKLRLTATLRLDQNGLVLEVTPDESPVRLEGDYESKSKNNSQTLIAYSKWNTESLLDSLEKIDALWSNWKATSTGKVVAENDEEDLIGDVKQTIRLLEDAGPSGEMFVRFDNGLSIDNISHGHKTPVALTDSGLLSLIPSDSKIVHATTCNSLADWMSDELSDFEDRIEQQSWKALANGEEEKVEYIDSMIQSYYTDFRKFRRLIYDYSQETFSEPVGMIIDSQGEVSGLTLKWKAAGYPHEITMQDAPMIECAFIAKIKDQSKAKRFFSIAWKEFTKGCGLPPQSKAMIPMDLQIGAPTAVFSNPLNSPTLTLNRNTSLSRNDTIPHVTIIDEWIVFSTSARLTRSIVDTKHGKTAALAMSAQSNKGTLVGFGLYDSGAFQSCLKIGANLAEAAATGGEKLHVRGEFLEEPLKNAGNGFQIIYDLGRNTAAQFSYLRFETTQTEDTRSTTLRMPLAP